MSERREIHCCGCAGEVSARLTNGQEIYSHRPDLYSLPFWKCDACGNYVGTHHKDKRPGKDPLRPKGTIPTPEIRRIRSELHEEIDPLWRDGLWTRRGVYRQLSACLGFDFHVGEVNSAEAAHMARNAVETISRRQPS